MPHAATSSRRGEGAFGLIVGLGILFVVVVACARILPLYIHGNEVLDAMKEAADFGGLKSPERLQMEVFQKAQNAKVPLKMESIHVDHIGSYITISAQYQQTADIFGYQYVYRFNEKVERPVF